MKPDFRLCLLLNIGLHCELNLFTEHESEFLRSRALESSLLTFLVPILQTIRMLRESYTQRKSKESITPGNNVYHSIAYLICMNIYKQNI